LRFKLFQPKISGWAGFGVCTDKLPACILGVAFLYGGPGSVVVIATAYGLDGPGARFSAPVQTGPEAHPASCTRGTGSLPGVRCGRGVTLTPHPLLVLRSKIE